MKRLVQLIIFVAFIQLIMLGCTNNEDKIEVIDSRMVSDEFAVLFLKKYLDQIELNNIDYFILNSYRERKHGSDSLVFSIRPILQKSDSMTCYPMEYCRYKEKTIFIVLDDHYCSFLIDPYSKTISFFRKVVRSMPVYEKDYRQFPQWSIRFYNYHYGRIDASYRDPQLLPSTTEFSPPKIKPDE